MNKKLRNAELKRLVVNTLLIYKKKLINMPFSRDGHELMCPSREMGFETFCLCLGIGVVSFALTQVRALYCCCSLLPGYEHYVVVVWSFALTNVRALCCLCPSLSPRYE